MKQYVRLVSIITCLFFCSLSARSMDVSLYQATFTPSGTAFTELHFFYIGQSITWVTQEESDLLQASVAVEIKIYTKDDALVKQDSFTFKSPWLEGRSDLLDLRRYSLSSGEYLLIVRLVDKANPANKLLYTNEFQVESSLHQPSVSDILLLSDLTKSDNSNSIYYRNGFEMTFLPYHLLGGNQSMLRYYFEVYFPQGNTTEEYELRTEIRQQVNEEYKSIWADNKRRKVAPVDPIVKQIPMSTYPSGDYLLVVEVRDVYQKLLAKKIVAFKRLNPRLDQDKVLASAADIKGEFVDTLEDKELDYAIRALLPIMGANQASIYNAVLEADSSSVRRRYLYSFWIGQSPNTPGKAYEEYMTVAREVDKRFYNAFGYGFESDRGVIFLRYGAPNDFITVDTEPMTPPYEIWVYEGLPKQPSVTKFLFYNPSLAGGNYQLLHSNARGETKNPNWIWELYRNYLNNATNETQMGRLQDQDLQVIIDELPNSQAIRWFNDI